MENKILEIINSILIGKDMPTLVGITPEMDLRNDIGFDSIDLAEFTVKVEDFFDVDVFSDGIVSTINEVYAKLKPAD
jgi:acyl carrier protein